MTLTQRKRSGLRPAGCFHGRDDDWEYRAKWYGEDETTAKKMLPKMEDMTNEGENEIE